MDDNKIISLYFARDEDAIRHTKEKYGLLLFNISYGILNSAGDAEECVNDTYMSAWQSIPPTRPQYFSAFLSKITRNISFNRYRQNKRRWGGKSDPGLIFEELAECIPAKGGDITEDIAIRDCLNRFLAAETKINRVIFVKRYFFAQDFEAIAEEVGLSQTAIRVALSRLRKRLRGALEREGIIL